MDAEVAALGHGWPFAAAHGAMPSFGHAEPRRGTKWWGKAFLVTFGALPKVTRCKSGTASRHYRSNGYVLNQQNPGHLSGHLRKQDPTRKSQTPDSTKGSRSSPLILSSRALFLLLRGGLLLFLVAVALYRCFWRSPSGIKSKRIFLSADLLFRLAIQPIRELPEGSFIVLCPVAGCS
ncbi:hypothetical protein QMK47_10965 [Pseudomonas sp. P9_35]|uniref:hypothetical protein n=1 Tax=unclassified Pseudomonas TaxID=196821 RepID=UPI002A36736C|nr:MULTISPECIES: hypothetical protein [unclassified Pseudomonas]WPN66424.1 hypothetical protein QMK48_10055 [Pseudomonas sp. P9_32]WPN72006.1 hypothetical protein QMK47_10965 [Pseudomonas sp. P9_35]